MRIAVVCPYSLDLPGGVQGQAMGMAVGFAQEHEVTVFAPGTNVPEVLSVAGVTTVLLGRSIGVRANGSVAPISLSFRACARLRKDLRELRAQVCIIHEPLVPIISLAALGGRAGLRVGTFHRAGITRGYRLLRFIAAPLLSRLDTGVVVSEEARATVASLVRGRADGYSLIANAVDIARFAPPVTNVRAKKSVLFIGRHEYRKGLSVLLEAFATLPQDFTLLVGGAGPETDDLRQRFPESSQIHWLGSLGNDEVVRYLHGVELFVAPSLGGESFGVVLLEAMAAGTPVLASDLPGYYLAADDAARYVTPGEPSALAAAIVGLSADVELREEMCRRGLERAERFTFRDLCDRYLELVHETMHEA
jgi:phosphatidylinositol alpha-mannosyltransferase